MEEQIVDIKIRPDGKIDIDLIGFKGTSCEETLKNLNRALGGQIESQIKKRDYYEESNERIRETN
jgi:hypothetical protein